MKLWEESQKYVRTVRFREPCTTADRSLENGARIPGQVDSWTKIKWANQGLLIGFWIPGANLIGRFQDEGGNTELFEEEIMVPFEIWVTFETGGWGIWWIITIWFLIGWSSFCLKKRLVFHTQHGLHVPWRRLYLVKIWFLLRWRSICCRSGLVIRGWFLPIRVFINLVWIFLNTFQTPRCIFCLFRLSMRHYLLVGWKVKYLYFTLSGLEAKQGSKRVNQGRRGIWSRYFVWHFPWMIFFHRPK